MRSQAAKLSTRLYTTDGGAEGDPPLPERGREKERESSLLVAVGAEEDNPLVARESFLLVAVGADELDPARSSHKHGLPASGW